MYFCNRRFPKNNCLWRAESLVSVCTFRRVFIRKWVTNMDLIWAPCLLIQKGKGSGINRLA